MEAIFNISLLAAGARNTRSRTGVYTYARGLARQFAGDPEVGFGLPAGGWLDSEFEAQEAGLRKQIVPRSALQAADLIRSLKWNRRQGWSNRLDRWLSTWEPRGTWAGVFHHPWFGGWPRWTAKCNRCLTVHDVIAWKHPEWFDEQTAGYRERWSRWILEADWLICDSEATRVDLLDVFPKIPADRTRVVPLGPSFSFAPGIAGEDLLPEALRDRSFFLTVCTIEPRKNLKRLLEAFERFKELSRSECLLVLVGGGGWLESLPKLLGGMAKHRESVLATGYLPDEVLPCLYRKAIGFVYPSLYEGFGLPVLDAMTAGTPVITSLVSSLPEITGAAALLIDPRDVDAIADAMVRLECDAQMRASLSRDGRERARLFGWERCARETKAVYMAANADTQTTRSFPERSAIE